MNRSQISIPIALTVASKQQKVFLLILAIMLTFCNAGFAQKASKWLEKGDIAFQNKAYTKALSYYEWAAKDSNNWQALLGVAHSHRALSEYKKALPFFEKVTHFEQAPASSFFYLGHCYMVAKQYEEAEINFKKYVEAQKENALDASFNMIEDLVKMVMADSSEYEVRRLPINSQHSDFSPAYFGNGLLFSSARPNDLGIVHTSTVNDAPLIDLYFAESDTNGKWSRPSQFGKLNTKLNEGPLVYDTLNQILYLTRNDPNYKSKATRSARGGLNRLLIQSYSLIDGEWVEGEKLPFNNEKIAVGHPAITNAGQTMVFASDKPGGFGGADLYCVQHVNGAWTTPVNLGPEINTKGDELFPHIGGDGLLYFSSNGHIGLGGLDLYFARPKSKGAWNAVQNLGFPLNSEVDDFGIIVDPSGNKGYFSSNRNGDASNDNIYEFKRSWPIFDCQEQEENNYCFLFWETGVLDDDTLPLAYEWDFGDGTKARGLSVRHCFEGPGDYHVELNLIDTVVGITFMHGVSGEYQVRDIEQVFIDAPDAALLGQEITLDAGKSIYDGCDIEKYFWEINDGFRAKGVAAKHTFEAIGEYEIKLGVTGIPDETGQLVCKKCVTKKILILAPEALKARQDSIQKASQRLAPNPLSPTDSTVGQPLSNQMPIVPGQATDEFNLAPDKDEKYTVLLETNDEKIKEKSQHFEGLEKVKEIQKDGDYEYHYGLADSLKLIMPYFQKAHDRGFDDAIVVKVDPMDYKKPSLVIPVIKNQYGYTLFGGQITDEEGNPLDVEITFEDLDKNLELFRKKTDSLGNFEIRLDNGAIYSWSVEKDSFFPANGYLDLREGHANLELEEKIRKQIKLAAIENLVSSGKAYVLDNIFFDFDKDVLRPESFIQLDLLARILAENPDINVELSAHTDSYGDDAYNFDLSRRRAYSVLRYLILNGIDVSRIKSKGMGESQPRVPNTNAKNRQLNRRVEFVFSK